ncbi:hypothetical protein PGA57_05470 [Latilactobacillus curvatus]|uniref:hypothetical protein n=1 Tax=Latilactobacillus curvatus TaxID=28038 RepID=UPI0022F3E88D|nr:hypothetical protein [Latilactobacillus curvatus]WBY48127.1 hypothetical protein PGA57_05470 [Latilactobacillus curvatus]
MDHSDFTDEQQLFYENLEKAVELSGNDFATGYKTLLDIIYYRVNKELSNAYENMPEEDRRAVISDYCLPY